MRDLIRPDASFTPRELFARMQGAWFEPRLGYMWQEDTGVTPTTSGGQTIGKLVDLSAARVASQSTVANRPTYQLDAKSLPYLAHDRTDSLSVSLPAINVRRNLLTYSEQFDNVIWAMFGGPITRTTNAVYATPYTKQATLISSSSSAANGAYLVYVIPTSATRYTFTIRAKQYNKRVVWLYYLNAAAHGLYFFDLGDGSTQIVAGSTQTGTVSMSADGDGWYKCSLTITGFSGSGYWGFGVADAKGSTSVTAGSGIYVADAQLELGSVATDYQKITDWTSEQYSSAGSVYFGTPQGMSCLHNQSIGTSYNLPALQTDIYGVVITPARLAPPLEQRLALYMHRLAGLSDADFFWQEQATDGMTGQLLADDNGTILLRG